MTYCLAGTRELSSQMIETNKFGLPQCIKERNECQQIGIVGAGAAGLYCGILLAQAGHTVRIYEASNRAGGRISTYRDPNNPSIYMSELGAMRLPLDTHSYLNTLIRERYKLNITPFANSNDNAYAYVNGIFGTMKELRENPIIFKFNMTKNEQGKTSQTLWLTAFQPILQTLEQGGWLAVKNQWDSYSIDSYLKSVNMSRDTINYINILRNYESVNDKRNSMTTKPVSAEVKLRWNATLKCADMYKYILSNQDILKAISQFSLNISMNQTFNLNLTETNTTSSLIILLRFEIFAACLTYGLGFIGNLFALIVFSSLLEFRRISTGILFLLMTISNFFHLWTLAIDFLGICGYSIYSNIYLQCHLSPFVENISRAMSTYFSVGIAVDRFIRSEMPLRSKMICTRKNIFIVTIIIFIIFCLFWSFYLYPFSSQILITGECIYNQSISFEFFLVNIHIPLRAIFFCLIPIIIMTASNIRMMSNIRQARMRVSDIPQNNDGYKSSTIISSTAISGPVGRRTLAIDRMLLLMMAASVLTFIITQIPFHIYMVVQVNIHTFNSYTDSLIYSMLLIWSSIYFGIAFYLYCLASPLFRRKFIRIGRKLINCQLIYHVTT
ncbi:unnamed protein product [Adineta steineri]|uniref:G-protein coupled receptors family 1 profile domain-containing protein n=3 Tax=Adineta steineri TaxID=433720 RepID=A0A813SCZ8_9BILA|nr:unnamed protein product [Adineta steineri]